METPSINNIMSANIECQSLFMTAMVQNYAPLHTIT